jgi:hypothetical protein
VQSVSELVSLEKLLNRKRFDRFANMERANMNTISGEATDQPQPDKIVDYHASIDVGKSRFKGSALDLFHPNFIEMMDKDIEKERESEEITDRMRSLTERPDDTLSPRQLIDRY